MPSIHLQIQGPVARLLIDHPERRNAFTRSMWRSVPDLMEQALASTHVRVVCLQSSSPGVFASGADISEFEQIYGDPEQALAATLEIQRATDALERCPLPTVAAVDGACVGGGVALAVSCDMRIASERSRFAITPARLGLSYHPDDLRRLVRACGWSHASQLLYSGRLWTADRALGAGLVNEVHSLSAFESEVNSLLEAITHNSRVSTQAIKRGLQAVDSRNPVDLSQADQEFVDLFQSADFVEGRDAFLEKRPASFPSHRLPEKP